MFVEAILLRLALLRRGELRLPRSAQALTYADILEFLKERDTKAAQHAATVH